MLRGLTWAVLCAWIQNNPQVVGTCQGHQPQPIGKNLVFKIEMPGPPLFNRELKIQVTIFHKNVRRRSFEVIFRHKTQDRAFILLLTDFRQSQLHFGTKIKSIVAFVAKLR